MANVCHTEVSLYQTAHAKLTPRPICDNWCWPSVISCAAYAKAKRYVRRPARKSSDHCCASHSGPARTRIGFFTIAKARKQSLYRNMREKWSAFSRNACTLLHRSSCSSARRTAVTSAGQASVATTSSDGPASPAGAPSPPMLPAGAPSPPMLRARPPRRFCATLVARPATVP